MGIGSSPSLPLSSVDPPGVRCATWSGDADGEMGEARCADGTLQEPFSPVFLQALRGRGSGSSGMRTCGVFQAAEVKGQSVDDVWSASKVHGSTFMPAMVVSCAVLLRRSPTLR